MNPKDLHCSIGGAKPVGRCVAQADLPQPVPLAAADPKATVRLNAAKRMLWVAQVRPASRSYQMVPTQVVFSSVGSGPRAFERWTSHLSTVCHVVCVQTISCYGGG